MPRRCANRGAHPSDRLRTHARAPARRRPTPRRRRVNRRAGDATSRAPRRRQNRARHRHVRSFCRAEPASAQKTPHHHAAPAQAWDDALYAKRKPEIISEVDGKFCCLVEWVEQPLPPTEKAIRDTIRKAGPTLPKAIIDAVPKEDPSETGKLDILAFADESGLTTSVLDSLQQHKHVGAKKVVNVYDNDDLLDAEKVEELLADQWDVVVFGAGADSPESNDPDAVVKWSDRLIKVFLTLVKIIQRKPAYAKKLFVLTTDTHSNEAKTWTEAGVGLVAASHLFGMCNTCRLELPSTPIHYVDCEYKVDDDLVEQIGYEVSRKAGFGENSVRLNWRGRFVARMVLAEPRYTSNKVFRPPSTGVVGIGGGNGALGLVMGKYLLERLGDQRKTASLEIKFLSRSCKVQPAQQSLWDDVQRLASEGSIKVSQEKCDVSSREAVEAFVSEHADRLVGFVHSAGILRDVLLMNQDAEKYDAVFKPKACRGVPFFFSPRRVDTPTARRPGRLYI